MSDDVTTVEITVEKENVLRSRRFISSVVGFVLMFVAVPLFSEAMPGWEINQFEAAKLITSVILALIGGYSAQDGLREIADACFNWAEGKSLISETEE